VVCQPVAKNSRHTPTDFGSERREFSGIANVIDGEFSS